MHTNLIPLNAGNETQFLSQHYQQTDELIDRNSIGGKLISSLHQFKNSLVIEIFKLISQFPHRINTVVSLRSIL